MKKNILITLVFIALCFNAHAIEYTWTWTGNAGDKQYATTGNWSISPAADVNTAAMGYPRNLLGHTSIAVFNGSAEVNGFPPQISSSIGFFLQRLDINSGTVEFNNLNASNSIMGFSGLGLFISSGARLNVKGSAGLTLLFDSSTNNCTIAGTLDLTGTGTSSTASKLLRSGTSVNSVLTVNSGGKIIISGTSSQIGTTNTASLKFQSGSTLEITREGGTIPAAQYQSGSLIRVLKPGANRVTLPAIATNSFIGDTNVSYGGDIELDAGNGASGQGGSPNQWSLNSSTNAFGGTFFVKSGYVKLLGAGLATGSFGGINLSGGTMELWPNSAAGAVTVSNDINVSGGTLNLNIATNQMVITLNGNLIQSGGTIDLATPATGTAIGYIILKGNMNQSAGTFTESGTSGTATAAPRVIFKGTAAQTATLSGTLSGNLLMFTIDNAGNDVTLLSNATLPYRLQCTAGSLILGSNNLTVTDKVLGSRTAGGVVTNGTGTLMLKNIDNVGKDFPVRFSNASHDPVYITNTTGTADFTVRVSNTVTPMANLNVSNLLSRQWEVASTSTAANLEFEPDPLAGATPTAGSRSIARYNGSTWLPSAAVDGVNNGYPYAADFTAFSSFVVGTTSVIPVELVNFKAKYTNNSNTLTWQTASERNAQQFDIQRSADGVSNWTNIGSVKAQGNSQALLNYQFADETPLRLSYYRLRTLDLDGKAQVSKTVSINRQATGKLSLGSISSLYTEGGTLTFDINLIERANLNITLTDAIGRAVLTKNYATVEGNNQIQLNTTGLAKGVYIINIADGQSSVAVKMVKQ